MFLRNHDELTLEMVTDEERDYMYRVYAADPRARINLGIRRRLAPLLGNSRRKMELMNTLLLSMPARRSIYYGDEIGMGDNFYLGDATACAPRCNGAAPERGLLAREPAAALPAGRDRLGVSLRGGQRETQDKNLSSPLGGCAGSSRCGANARRWPWDDRISFPGQSKVLSFSSPQAARRSSCWQTSRASRSPWRLICRPSRAWFRWSLQQNKFPAIRQTPYSSRLSPHGHYWLKLEPVAQRPPRHQIWRSSSRTPVPDSEIVRMAAEDDDRAALSSVMAAELPVFIGRPACCAR